MDEKKAFSQGMDEKAPPLPANFSETFWVDRLECSVRNFLLRSACKVGCFYTVKEEKKSLKRIVDEWLDNDSEDEEEELLYEEMFNEKHFVALPSIVISNSENPNHKLQVNCLVSPPLTDYQKERLEIHEEVLLSIEK